MMKADRLAAYAGPGKDGNALRKSLSLTPERRESSLITLLCIVSVAVLLLSLVPMLLLRGTIFRWGMT